MNSNNNMEWLYRRIFGSDNDPGDRFVIAFCMLVFLYFTARFFLA